MSSGVWGRVLIATCLSATAEAQAQPRADAEAPPPLPVIAIESFAPEARAAIAVTLAAARQPAADAVATGALGMTLQAWEQWELTHAVYTRAQALAPQSADWPYLDGVVLQRLARHGEAAAQFRRALALAPDYVPAAVRLAEALYEAGDLDASAGAYTTLTDLRSAAPVAALGLGRLAARAGRHAEAVQHFSRAVALFPEFGAAYYGLAQSLRALGRLDAARTALERHRTYGPRWPALDDPWLARVTPLRDDARVLLARGLRQAELGDLAGAIQTHEAALARNPLLAQAHANLISLYGQAGQWAQADAHYKALLALGFNQDDAHYNYAVLLDRQRRFGEAAAAYRLALASNPLHAQAQNNLGQLLELERQPADALDAYRRAVAADPRLRIARYNVARMLMAARQMDEAVAEFEKLREPQDAESPRYLYGLAVAYVQTGRRDAGVALARVARQRAERFGQRDLVAAIDRDLARLP
ncbi:MAG: tetratricopeptide repeat protein [Vicinamibacteria bacterium]|nr:tetratricopeptide repeat protein [Vicinamibacteria bacterium]